MDKMIWMDLISDHNCVTSMMVVGFNVLIRVAIWNNETDQWSSMSVTKVTQQDLPSQKLEQYRQYCLNHHRFQEIPE
jgi:hypothetical protein